MTTSTERKGQSADLGTLLHKTAFSAIKKWEN